MALCGSVGLAGQTGLLKRQQGAALGLLAVREHRPLMRAQLGPPWAVPSQVGGRPQVQVPLRLHALAGCPFLPLGPLEWHCC